MPDIKTLQSIVIEAARTQLPLQAHAGKVSHTAKVDGSIVTQIDINLQSAIHAELIAHWPDIPLLGEEMSHDEQAALLANSAAGLWVLDPLDGTTNFATGFPIFGVSLAYVKHGRAQLAVIYDPVREECFSAELNKGTTLNGQFINQRHSSPDAKSAEDKLMLGDCVANIDYKRLTEHLSNRLVVCPPYRSQRNIGSCVLEWCWLAADRFQLYLHGGQQLWDHAAGRLILAEAGGWASRIDGSEICANKLTKQSVVAASNAMLFKWWLEWIQHEK